MKNSSSYKTAIFDCDGVILDSNSIKTDAFRAALGKEPKELVDQFIQYHKANGGVSRYKKIRHYFTRINPVGHEEQRIEDALNKYSYICAKNLEVAALIPGVEELLVYYKEVGVRCYVVSGGSQEELRCIFSRRNLDRYFEKVCGSPRSKIEILDKLEEEGVLKRSMVYFGDSRSDYQAAMKFNCEFVMIYGKSEWADWRYTVDRNFFNDFEAYLRG